MFDRIYIDMDGVLADFEASALSLLGMPPEKYEAERGSNRFWEAIWNDPKFFQKLALKEGADELMSMCSGLSREKLVVLSSPSRTNRELSVVQKRAWLDCKFGSNLPAIFEGNKQKFAGPNRLLIDDSPKKIRLWKEAGGVGHLYVDFQNFESMVRKTVQFF